MKFATITELEPNPRICPRYQSMHWDDRWVFGSVEAERGRRRERASPTWCFPFLRVNFTLVSIFFLTSGWTWFGVWFCFKNIKIKKKIILLNFFRFWVGLKKKIEPNRWIESNQMKNNLISQTNFPMIWVFNCKRFC